MLVVCFVICLLGVTLLESAILCFGILCFPGVLRF